MIMEGAAAYAVVKALLPVRLVFSIVCMPWFARVAVLPITSRLPRLFGKKKPANKAENALESELADKVKVKTVEKQDPQRPRL